MAEELEGQSFLKMEKIAGDRALMQTQYGRGWRVEGWGWGMKLDEKPEDRKEISVEDIT